MAAESAFGGPRQIVASGETVKRPADLRPLRHRNRHSQRVRQLCPENCADTLETEADFGGDRADEQRGADDQIVEAGVWGNSREVVEGSGQSVASSTASMSVTSLTLLLLRATTDAFS